MSALDALAKLLREKPRTAKDIVRLTGCSKPTAYARIAALRARGDAVYELTAAVKSTGPAPKSYGIR